MRNEIADEASRDAACPFCEKRSTFYGIENGNKSSWRMSWDDGEPVIRVDIDNPRFGFTHAAELPIARFCPLCGKELR